MYNVLCVRNLSLHYILKIVCRLFMHVKTTPVDESMMLVYSLIHSYIYCVSPPFYP